MTEWITRMSVADAQLLRALAARRTPGLTRFFRGFTHMGDPPVPVLVVGLLLAGLPGLSWLHAAGLHAAWSLILAFAVSQVVKRTISRPRPALPVGLASIIKPPDRFSFPSGHATASLAVALPVALGLLPLWGMSAVLLLVVAPALLVGVSRCYLGVHYPGDVAAGWVIGTTSALLTGWLLGG